MDDLTRTRELLSRQLTVAIDVDPISALRTINEIHQDTSRHMRDAVRAAATSSSWAQIGDALSISKQAAHQRFKEYADTMTAEIKLEHKSMKKARRRGDAARAAEAKSKRDALVTDLKQAARDLRNGN
ncbi:MAG: hypothetical protein Q7R41_18220 [Phycisphaerales bacterium]|nr:hypothetical protein [Phycisphaerales bacterium]